jgi:4'-phosphopantetheinyl transferase
MALRRINSPSDLGGLRYSAENKPYFERGPFFSISHSANRVVCFVSEEAEVGIDIEKIGNICPDEFRDQFAPAEWSVIKGSSDPIETFYWLWTAKESVIKGDGRGLGLALPLVDVTGGESVCIDGRIWGLTRVPYFQGYACHLVVEAGGDASNPGLDPALAVEAFEPYELG